MHRVAAVLVPVALLTACNCGKAIPSGHIYAANSYSNPTEPVDDITSGQLTSFATVNSNGWTGPLAIYGGHLYVATLASGGSIFDITPGGDQTAAKAYASNIFGSGLSYTEGFAFDSSSNAYLTNSESGSPTNVAKVSPSGQVTSLSTAFNNPTGLLVVGNNLYITVGGDGRIVKHDLTSGAETNFATGFVSGSSHISGEMALRSDGKILVLWQPVNGTTTGLYDVTAGGDFSSATSLVDATFYIDVNQIAVNAAGDVFAPAGSGGAIWVSRRSGNSYAPFATFASGFSDTEAVVISP